MMRRHVVRALPVTIAVTLLPAGPVAAHGGAPAGGAPTEDLIPATIVAVVLVAAVGLFGWAHRTGRTRLLHRLAAFSERVGGMPAYAAIPAAMVGVSLLVAVFGFYWDVSTHIDNGRDPGPFANPSHWFILVGLLGIALAGVLSLLIGVEDDEPGVRLREGWRVPIGGLLITTCGLIALLGFPLDDVWHRIFGQDVTLWSPTHIQMVGGASLSTLSLWLLVLEGRRSPRTFARPPLVPRATEVMLAGAFLVGASTMQAEFDFGVPQFRLVYQPLLIMLAGGIALVPARIRLGRGGAIQAALFFIALRGVLTLLVTPVLGRVLLHFPLYLGAAIAVELVALRVSTDRQLSFGAWAGVGVGTVGLASAWAWSHVWMPIPWPTAMLAETLALAVPAAVAGGVVGGFVSRALVEPAAPRQSAPAWVAPAAAVVVVVLIAWPVPMAGADGATAEITLEDIAGGDARTVQATVRLDPPDIAEGAEFLNITAWQGAAWRHGVNSFVDPLERVEPGVYRSTRPIPVHGEWKALVRLHDDRVMAAAPIYLPEDEAIPADEVPAESSTRDFVRDKQILQREAQEAPAGISLVAYALALGILAVWIAAIGWGIRRLRQRATAGSHVASAGAGVT